MRRRFLAVALLTLLLAVMSTVMPKPAQASTCRDWTSASWGKAWVCVDYTLVSGKLKATHVYGQDMDTKTDGYCVYIERDTYGGGYGFPGKACTLNKAVNYSSYTQSSTPFCSVMLVEITGDYKLVRYMTLWSNPYTNC